MGSIDDITWQALTVALTLIGVVSTGVLWRSRGPAIGLRMLALTLLPAAAYLTGTLRLVWEIADAVVSWAVRFAFSPSVWLGLILAGTAAATLVLSGVLRRRGIGVRPADRRSAGSPGELGPKAGRRPAAPRTATEEDDIEAILRKHGIS